MGLAFPLIGLFISLLEGLNFLRIKKPTNDLVDHSHSIGVLAQIESVYCHYVPDLKRRKIVSSIEAKRSAYGVCDPNVRSLHKLFYRWNRLKGLPVDLFEYFLGVLQDCQFAVDVDTVDNEFRNLILNRFKRIHG